MEYRVAKKDTSLTYAQVNIIIKKQKYEQIVVA